LIYKGLVRFGKRFDSFYQRFETVRLGVMEKQELTLAVIEGLKRQGLNQSEIARLFGVTPQAVSYHVRKYGGVLSPRQKVLESWPFVVPTVLGQQAVCRRLRDHGEFWATQGAGMGFVKLNLLKGFYDRLKAQVVEFDPALPPSEGISEGGFAYRERVESDGDLLIRVNQHTHLSDEGRKIWRLPDVLPDPLAGKV
jgi:hypothetical protein